MQSKSPYNLGNLKGFEDEKNIILNNNNKMIHENNIILSGKWEELLEEKMRFKAKINTEIKNSFENIYQYLASENSEKT